MLDHVRREWQSPIEALADVDHWRGRYRFSYSGDPWLDRVHDAGQKAAIRKLMPGVDHVLMVGDMHLAGWVKAEFGADVEHVFSLPAGVDDPPELVLLLDSLTVYRQPELVMTAARAIGAEWLLVTDDFSSPTPIWKLRLTYRRPLPYPDLLEIASKIGWRVAGRATVDVMHRRLFLAWPRPLAPAAAAATFLLDAIARRLVPPEAARHQAWLFRAAAIGLYGPPNVSVEIRRDFVRNG